MTRTQVSMTLPKGHGQKASTAGKRSYESWWATVPEDLRQKAAQRRRRKQAVAKPSQLRSFTSPFSWQA